MTAMPMQFFSAVCCYVEHAMLKRVFWLMVVAIGGWLAWQWFRQRQSEFGDTMPHFAPAPRYSPPAPLAASTTDAPTPSATQEAPEAPDPALAPHELDELFAEDTPAPTAPATPEAPTTAAPAADSAAPEIVGYCMRCRTKRPIQNAHEEISESGRRAARGTCPVCRTNMFVFLATNEDERGVAQ